MVEMVYSRASDSIVRVSFAIHGKVIESFGLRNASFAITTLPGKDLGDNDIEVNAAEYDVGNANYQDGPFWHSPSEPRVYFVKDPDSGAYGHLAVYVEYGGHEPWPNPTGKVISKPKHNGKGISFLPTNVNLLHIGSQSSELFAYYAGIIGKAGESPVCAMRHRFWYRSNGEDGSIPCRAYPILRV